MQSDNKVHKVNSIKILKYIKSKGGQLPLENILKKFPENKYSTSIRLEEMAHPKTNEVKFLSESFVETIDDVSGYQRSYTNVYSLTPTGEMYIQDYDALKYIDWSREFVRSFVFPTLVAIIVSYLSNRFLFK